MRVSSAYESTISWHGSTHREMTVSVKLNEEDVSFLRGEGQLKLPIARQSEAGCDSARLIIFYEESEEEKTL